MAETPATHRFPAKDPDETLDYTFDFTELLQAAEKINAIIVTTIATVTTPPLTVVSDDIVTPANKEVTVFLSGGLVCHEYLVSVRIDTDSAPTARIIERSCILPVRNR